MRGARDPMSFSLSICHQGLKTAPGGDFFNRIRKFSISSRSMIVGYGYQRHLVGVARHERLPGSESLGRSFGSDRGANCAANAAISLARRSSPPMAAVMT